MKRGLLKAALALCAAAVMLFGGSVRSMPEIVDPATLPTRSPSMSAMPPEPSEMSVCIPIGILLISSAIPAISAASQALSIVSHGAEMTILE